MVPASLGPPPSCRALGVLAGILDTAVRDGRIARNVARGAQNLPVKRSEKPRRYLTHGEVVRLTEAAGTSTHRTLILVLSYCGRHWSEATGMHAAGPSAWTRRRIA